ncbi:MAG: 23S rRNA (uracil(1939)-C(5))-methyltransferase RlmD, partial [Lentisphaeria bacterium]|nr:23S rRNA (uracil(1939)-C(5))-methyltransferase RlmD [Lentisphaeria bacterium]
PPRTGLAPNALKMLLDAEAGFVIYISCGPAALMRDLDLLAEKYQTEQIQLFDLFPSTGHFESIALLKRK